MSQRSVLDTSLMGEVKSTVHRGRKWNFLASPNSPQISLRDDLAFLPELFRAFDHLDD